MISSCSREFGNLIKRMTTARVPPIKYSIPTTVHLVVPVFETHTLIKNPLKESESFTNQGQIPIRPSIMYDIVDFYDLVIDKKVHNKLLSKESLYKDHEKLSEPGSSIKIEKGPSFCIELKDFKRELYTGNIVLRSAAQITEDFIHVTKLDDIGNMCTNKYLRNDVGIILNERKFDNLEKLIKHYKE